MSLDNVSPPAASPVAHHSLNLHFTTAPYCVNKSSAIFAILIIETLLINLYKKENVLEYMAM